MLAEHEARTLPSVAGTPDEAADAGSTDRSMAIMQWLIAIVAAAAAIILASVN